MVIIYANYVLQVEVVALLIVASDMTDNIAAKNQLS